MKKLWKPISSKLSIEKRQNTILVMLAIIIFLRGAANFANGTLQEAFCIAAIILFVVCVGLSLHDDMFQESVPDKVLESKRFPNKKYAIFLNETTLARIQILSETTDTDYNIKVVDLERSITVITVISKSSDIIHALDEHGVTEIQTAKIYLLSKKQRILEAWTEIVYPQIPQDVDAAVDALIKKQKKFIVMKAICMFSIAICLSFIFCILLLLGLWL